MLLIILLFVFKLGVYVGQKKAEFSYRWGENYHRVFGGPQTGFFQDFVGGDFIQGHGTAGTILKTDKTALVVKTSNNVEKTFTLSGSTVIRRGAQTVSEHDIQVGQNIVIIGSPKDDGTIEAEFIRILDPMEENRNLMPGRTFFRTFPH